MNCHIPGLGLCMVKSEKEPTVYSLKLRRKMKDQTAVLQHLKAFCF
jgi:hypothetical protein